MADTMVTLDFEFTHAFPVKPEIVGFSPLKGPTWIFFKPSLRKRTHWVQKSFLFFDSPTHFRFKPEIVGFRRFKSQKYMFSAAYLRKQTRWIQKWM